MHKNNFLISFGIWITILPFLGVPGSWKNTLTFLSGIFLILVFSCPIVFQKLQIKPKIKRKKIKNVLTDSQAEKEALKFSSAPDLATSQTKIKEESKVDQ
ncbi:MAG: hypothetical protein GX627_01690 [Parcubacteria group bacterium]|jgi:hypothetical protein|nr:hypothetical protein [Parcubacteria group bacterium]